MWINYCNVHYQPEIRCITGILDAIKPELDHEKKKIPLWEYRLMDRKLTKMVNVVYFDERLVDLSRMTPEEAAVESRSMGYDPPRALSWEWYDCNAGKGRNVWRTLPDGAIYNEE